MVVVVQIVAVHIVMSVARIAKRIPKNSLFVNRKKRKYGGLERRLWCVCLSRVVNFFRLERRFMFELGRGASVWWWCFSVVGTWCFGVVGVSQCGDVVAWWWCSTVPPCNLNVLDWLYLSVSPMEM